MPSTRRAILAAAAGGLAVALAGCGGEASSSEPDCSTTNSGHGDAEVIHSASVHPDDGDALFAVTLEEETDVASLDRLSVFDSEGDLAFTMPVVAGGEPDGTRRRYEQNLGPRPRHGRYHVEAIDSNGETVDEVTADVHCYRETEDE